MTEPNNNNFQSVLGETRSFPPSAEFVAKAAEFAADMYDRYVATKGDHEPMHHFND